jgi:hypothetical protein
MSKLAQFKEEHTVSQKMKILWVHDDFEGPMNGLGDYQGEKVWFSRSLIPVTISSTDVPIEKNGDSDVQSMRVYALTRLSAELLSNIEENHVAYCNQTGAPFNHGDPIKIRRKTQINKMDLSKIIPEGEDGIDATHRTLTHVKVYNHTYDAQSIFGEYVTTIKESDITNYFVPRRVLLE